MRNFWKTQAHQGCIYMVRDVGGMKGRNAYGMVLVYNHMYEYVGGMKGRNEFGMVLVYTHMYEDVGGP